MGRVQTRFRCQSCGQITSKWFGRCPGCGDWNTLAEEASPSRSPARPSVSSAGSVPVSLAAVDGHAESRRSFDWPEFDRVLGGGLVPGSLVLVGGDPGVGKSTLLLQASRRFADRWGPVLYVTGEESPHQIRLRAERLGAVSPDVWVLAETDVDTILRHIEARHPHLVIVDSIQTLTCAELNSSPGTIAQVCEAARRLQRMAKSAHIPTVIVGHVNKQGFLAGPKVLEHAVDAVLYIEGERNTAFRVLRAAKNRFGSTEEIGIFRMEAGGLEQVLDPSAALLAERPPNAPGSVVFAAVEGTRPLLVEVQALATPTPFGGTPRRQTTGIDRNRAAIVLAVLERRLGLPLQTHDVYLNVAGGVKLSEPAVDLAMALSLVSSMYEAPLDEDVVVFGEVGLTGELRGVSDPERRLAEAAKMGFRRAVLPAAHARRVSPTRIGGIELIGAGTLQEAIRRALPSALQPIHDDRRRQPVTKMRR